MNDEETLKRLSSLVADLLDLDSLVLTRSTTANDVEGWDSLAHVRIVVATEQEFGVRLSTSEIMSLRTVGELVDLVKSKSA
jgi:acyl carrier protein